MFIRVSKLGNLFQFLRYGVQSCPLNIQTMWFIMVFQNENILDISSKLIKYEVRVLEEHYRSCKAPWLKYCKYGLEIPKFSCLHSSFWFLQ